MGLFNKPFRVKSNSQMKGSDKKKLKQQLQKCFPTLTETDLNRLIPTKDEIITSKIYTFAGESVLLYIHDRDTVFFQMEKEKTFFPSVYTLWKHPKLLPVFTTMPPVLAKLINGADLMLPGIIIDETKGIKAYLDGKLEKGDLLSINMSNNSAPVAIGRAHRSSEDMYMAVRRGKGVDILHCYGDQLWSAGSRVELPDLGPPDLPTNASEEYDLDSEDDNADNDEAEAEEKAEESTDQSKAEAAESKPEDPVTDRLQELSVEETKAEEMQDDRSPAEIMDELLNNAFLNTWKISGKKIEFPVLTSNFFRLHMVKNAPPEVNLDPKKSSFKKLSKFLASQEKTGIIKIKELQKGVESIMSVDLEHESIRRFRSVKYNKEEEAPPAEDIRPCDKEYAPPKITELRMVNANVTKFFGNFKVAKGHGMTGSEVRDYIVRYVRENNLQDATSKHLVKLDPILADVVLGKGENHVVEMRWDEITLRFQAKMSDGYSLQFPGMPPSFHKGKLEPVELTTATRSGNKKITLVYNLENYGIDPTEFAHKCQVGVAASTAVNPAVNRKTGAVEVMVQGNQVGFASKLLMDQYKIPRKYVKGTENASKKKK